MNNIIVIPARMKSTRFPGKPLYKINGREMVLHVCDRVANDFETIVATPDQCIFDAVKNAGYNAIITGKHLTGTDRVAEVATMIDRDIYINVQGDEPLILISDIKNVVTCKELCYNMVVGSMTELTHNNANVVKVFTCINELRTMSRKGTSYYRQCGLYAFNKNELEIYSKMSYEDKIESLESNENIELMRFVDLHYPIFMQVINGSPSVDMLEDIKNIMEVISNERKD